ncbi:major facilitator superfamily domain-containing protein [Cubamyces menziesii]|nr:major facilitator superfamily domain-containing protein [Cubamyces menziesii]
MVRPRHTSPSTTYAQYTLSPGTTSRILVLSATAAISTSGVVAPRIEIYTRTICEVYGVDSASDACLADRTVQAAVAQLITVLSTTSGLLATLTTAWWGSLSDRYGRIWVLGFNVAGLMVSDLSFLTVAYCWDKLPGTYWWYVVGPAVEGLVGGISVASVVMHAYISDCSDPGTRSRAFSRLMGLLFFGMSVGPLLGGFIMRATRRLFPVFYATTTIDALVSLAVWFVIPESLPASAMQARRAQSPGQQDGEGAAESAEGAEGVEGVGRTLRRWGAAFDVVSPLSVLLPKKLDVQGKGRAVDWNLTILGAAYGFGTLVLASVYQQLQYASLTYGWTSETINYWMGGINISKAVYLTLLFPSIVKLLTYLRSPPPAPASSAAETDPLLPPSTEPESPAPTPTTTKKLSRAASLDLLLARAALVTDMLFYALIPTAATGTLFAIFGMCISLGASFGPVMQSLALELYARRGGSDTGRLLGALTVVSALSSHIIGPTLFGVTYMKTVGTVPGAIYGLCCASLMSTPRPPSREVSRLRDDAGTPRSRSRPGSRPRDSRHTTASSLPLLPDDLIDPGAPIGEEAAELLHEFVHPHHDSEDTLAGEGDALDHDAQQEEDEYEIDHAWREKLPWWKRPSPWWFLAYVPFSAIAMTITAAAKIELYTYLACEAHRPVVNPDRDATLFLGHDNPTYSLTLDRPDWQRVCHADPVVSAAVAELNIIMTTAMGILSCMTTAWWGALSDRVGRTRVMSCAVVGILLTDLNFILVYYFYKRLPGGYQFLVVAPILEGLLGGLSSMSANVHAYMADCTPPSKRSGTFSRYLGLLFTGTAIGPTLGGLVIRLSGSFISVFFIAGALHLLYALLIWFVVPESLSAQEMRAARARQREEEEEYRAAHAHGGARVWLKRMFAFLTPLLLFVPVRLDEPAGSPAKAGKRDWSLGLVVAAYGFTISLMGSYVYIMQYIQTFFEWNTEQVGYWFSTVGVTRALFLTVILPFIIRLAAPSKQPPIQLPTTPAEPLDSDPSHPNDTLPSTPTPSRPSSLPRSTSRSSLQRHPQHHHTPAFDLALARASLALDAGVYLLLTVAPNGLAFAATSCLGALGMGFGPAVQSVALALYNRRGGQDSGRLFGAMSVVQAMCAQIFGPFVYGLTYAKTVATFPKAIFLVATGAVVVSCILLAFVRLPPDAESSSPSSALDADAEEQLPGQAESDAHADSGRDTGHGREETLVDVGDDDVPLPPLIVVQDEQSGPKVVKP